MLGQLLGLRRPPPVTTAAGLAELAGRTAAYVAQKTVIDYCRAKSGSFSYALFEEKPFLDALELCKWEGFAAVLADLMLVFEAYLRGQAGGEAGPLAAALCALYAEVLDSHPLPAHRPQGWHDVKAALGVHLALAQSHPPAAPSELAKPAARQIYAALPIHDYYKELDAGVIEGALGFQMTAFWGTLQRRVDAAAVVADLLTGTAPAEGERPSS